MISGTMASAIAAVHAIPGADTHVPVLILGSSLCGAQLAAYLGLSCAFAAHFAPAARTEALAVCRRSVRPSIWLNKPCAMLVPGVCAAETDAEAAFLRPSQVLAFARMRTGATSCS